MITSVSWDVLQFKKEMLVANKIKCKEEAVKQP